MVKSQEVSNKTLLILIVAVTVVTIVSTWFIEDSVFDTKVSVGEPVGSAEVSLIIEDPNTEVVVEEEEESDSEAEVSLTIEESE